MYVRSYRYCYSTLMKSIKLKLITAYEIPIYQHINNYLIPQSVFVCMCVCVHACVCVCVCVHMHVRICVYIVDALA